MLRYKIEAGMRFENTSPLYDLTDSFSGTWESQLIRRSGIQKKCGEALVVHKMFNFTLECHL